MSREPMFGLTLEQEGRFFGLADQLRALGYVVLSEPIQGSEEGWLAGLQNNLKRIEERLAQTNRAFKCRGRSKAALYYLHSCERFDPGFGIHQSVEQREASRAYAAKIARGVARWNAIFGEETTHA